MREVYRSWKNFAEEALNYDVKNAYEMKDIERIVVLGMGGSGIVGDVLQAIVSEYSSLPFVVVKDFHVPKALVNGRTLVIAVSYSGNTLETIVALEQASRRTNHVAIVSSNGKLLEWASSRRVPFIKLREGLAPRAAFPLLLYGTIKLLTTLGIDLIPQQLIDESVEVLGMVTKAECDAFTIANFLKDSKLPLIVSSQRYASLAIRFKNELNENSKLPAKVELVPEAFHNDIVGWEHTRNDECCLVLLSDLEYENKLLKFYADYLFDHGFRILSFDPIGSNTLARIMYGFLVAGLASVDLAKIRGIDPLATESIAMYKKFVKELQSSIAIELS